MGNSTLDFSNIEAIIFDNDGVLVDSEVILIAEERQLLAEMGLEYSDQAYTSKFVGLSRNDFYSELAKDFKSRSLGEFPNDFGDRLRNRVWPRIDAELKAIEGAKELVAKFGGRAAVASSAVLNRLTHKLKITNLFDLFSPHIYSSEQVKHGKPQPDLFLHAASKLGVDPSNCMVIEDSENGVRAGRSAGMLTVGFTGGSHVDEAHGERLLMAGAHFVVDSHMEIAAAII